MKRCMGEVRPNLLLDIASQSRAPVEHGQRDHGHRQRRVVDPGDALHRAREQSQAFQGVILSLHRNKNLTGRDKGIDRHQAQTRRAVDENIVQTGKLCGLPAPQVLLQRMMQTRLAL